MVRFSVMVYGYCLGLLVTGYWLGLLITGYRFWLGLVSVLEVRVSVIVSC